MNAMCYHRCDLMIYYKKQLNMFDIYIYNSYVLKTQFKQKQKSAAPANLSFKIGGKLENIIVYI